MAIKLFIRERLNLSQQDLTRLTKVERSRIAHNERRKRSLPVDVLFLFGKFETLFQAKDKQSISSKEKKLHEETLRTEKRKFLENEEIVLQNKITRLKTSLESMRKKYPVTQSAFEDLKWILANGGTLNEAELEWVANQSELTRIKLKKLNQEEQLKMEISVASTEAGLKRVRQIILQLNTIG